MRHQPEVIARLSPIQKNIIPMSKSAGIETVRCTLGARASMHSHTAQISSHIGFHPMAYTTGQGRTRSRTANGASGTRRNSRTAFAFTLNGLCFWNHLTLNGFFRWCRLSLYRLLFHRHALDTGAVSVRLGQRSRSMHHRTSNGICLLLKFITRLVDRQLGLHMGLNQRRSHRH